ncbi:MAG: twin-arginine translocase TatA/TatE family subunit [Rhodothermales bacterium]
MSLGMPEIILIFLVVLLVFGAKRIPEIARGLGKGIREFKDATNDIKSELNVDLDDRRSIKQPRPPSQGSTAPRQSESYQPAESAKPEAGKSESAEAGSSEEAVKS